MLGRHALIASSLAAVAAVAPAGPAAAAGDPVMPLSEVRQGMQCTGYSVFRGTTVEPFGIEILDVVGQNVTGSPSTRLLVRASGANVERTGIGPGFSGSPIYCPLPDGTPANVGAISESVGEYGGLTVLATPIEAILATPLDAPAPARDRAAGPRGASDRRDAALLARAKPLAGPLTVSGLSRPVMRGLSTAARERGITFLQAPPAPLVPPPPQQLRPGSAMAVGLSSGDISIGAVGTVAYTDGPGVWSFGHLLDGVGGRALLLEDAYVATVVSNPVQSFDASTYKYAGPVNDLGTLSYDGFDAVAGRVGRLPALTPVTVSATDADRDVRTRLEVDVADETAAGKPTGYSNLSFIGPLAVSEAATSVLGALPLRVAGRMCLRAQLAELQAPLEFCNRYVSDGTVPSYDGGNVVASAAGADAAGALSLFDLYKGRNLHVEDVSATLSLTRGQRMAYLRSVKLPERVRRGSTVRARLGVKVVRGGFRRISFRWRVPEKLDKGRQKLAFVGTSSDAEGDFYADLSELFDDAALGAEGPTKVRQLVKAFEAFHRYDGIRLKRGSRVYRDDRYRIGGRVKTRVVVRPTSG